jgi:hypothetical protein
MSALNAACSKPDLTRERRDEERQAQRRRDAEAVVDLERVAVLEARLQQEQALLALLFFARGCGQITESRRDARDTLLVAAVDRDDVVGLGLRRALELAEAIRGRPRRIDERVQAVEQPAEPDEDEDTENGEQQGVAHRRQTSTLDMSRMMNVPRPYMVRHRAMTPLPIDVVHSGSR